VMIDGLALTLALYVQPGSFPEACAAEARIAIVRPRGSMQERIAINHSEAPFELHDAQKLLQDAFEATGCERGTS